MCILKKENLLLKYTKNLEKLGKNENECVEYSVFFHSKDMERALEFNSQKGIPFIYVARVGKTFDGHSLAQVVLNSQNIFVGSHAHIHMAENDLGILVTDTEKVLNALLQKAFQVDRKDFYLVGVTGTNGKTSVVQIGGQILERAYKKHVLKIGTLGMQIGTENLPVSHVTTPDFPAFLSALHVAKAQHVQQVVMEVTSHGLKENRLADTKMNVCVFTNLTQDHLDFHGNMTDYFESKKKLFSEHFCEDGWAVINTDGEEWQKFAQAAFGSKRTVLFVGCDKNLNQFEDWESLFHSVQYLNLTQKKSTLQGVSGVLQLISKNETSNLYPFSCPLLGDFQFENILCAVGIALASGVQLAEISPLLKEMKNIPGRLEVVQTTQEQPTVIVDYAHSPDALEKSIQTCRSLLKSGGKLITVFGCGGNRDALKRIPMGEVASRLSDIVMITSDNPRDEDPDRIIEDIFLGCVEKSKCLKEKDRKKALFLAIQNATKYDIVLIAGKGHETYQIFNGIKHPFSDADVALHALREKILT